MARDLEYGQKNLRLSDEVWEDFREQRLNSKLSVNLFVKKMLDDNKKKNKTIK